MNKEQQELIDRAYDKFSTYLHDNQIFINSWDMDSFVRDCKKDSEYGKMWGLKIEERELTEKERVTLLVTKIGSFTTNSFKNKCDENNIPTKLITVTRELSHQERSDLKNTPPYKYGKPANGKLINERLLDSNRVPTTKTIESYE